METTTNIRKMLSDKKISVPTYQRAYSWESPIQGSTRRSQVREYYEDINNHYNSGTTAKYYLGHFLFEEKETEYNIIDGQQRLTTTTIFVAAIFRRIQELRELTDDETDLYEDLIKRRTKIRFATVDYDNALFCDYVINHTTKNTRNLETESAKRIVAAYNYFKEELSNKDVEYLNAILNIVAAASCTTHIVKNESEAIQMFIFQNNRGKLPSNLEIIKAQFMYTIHLLGGESAEDIIYTVKNRFEIIYKSISHIEGNINEDDVLNYTIRVYYNSLREDNAMDKINQLLQSGDAMQFIEDFSLALQNSFESLKSFFNDEKKSIDIHSFVQLKSITNAYPFIIKAYNAGAPIETVNKLCRSLESLIFRHRVIGTKADIRPRINDQYRDFDGLNIEGICNRIEYLKSETSYWWSHWNNENLRISVSCELNHSIARYILWKYENYLGGLGKSGYAPQRVDAIISPEMEHIAPKTKTSGTNTGYGRYSDSFKNESIECIGNYLLIPKSHNCSIGNIKFQEKLATYTVLKQQQEIKTFLDDSTQRWDAAAIGRRKEKLINFIMENL